MGHARRDEDAPLVAVADVECEGTPLGRRALSQVVEHDARPSPRHVPVVRLVEVVVEPDDRAGLLVRAVALDHLAAGREPRAAVGLDEAATFVAVELGRHDDDAGDDGRLLDPRHGRRG